MSQGYSPLSTASVEQQSTTPSAASQYTQPHGNQAALSDAGLSSEPVCHPDGGLWEGLPIGAQQGVPGHLSAGVWLEGSFPDPGAAITFARTLAASCAVIHEPGDFYGVYELEVAGYEELPEPAVLTGSSTVSGVPGVVAFVTGDGYLLQPARTAAGAADRSPDFQRQDSPLAGQDAGRLFQDAAGEGLSDIESDADFIAVFAVVMRDVALEMVRQSGAAAAQRQAELAGGMSAEDALTIQIALDRLIEIDTALGYMRQGADSQPCRSSHDGPTPTLSAQERAGLMEERSLLLARCPLLGRVNLPQFQLLSEAEQAESLSVICGEVAEDAAQTREHLASGRLNLWTLEPVVYGTLSALSVTGARAGMVLEKSRTEEREDALWQAAMGVLSVALGLGALAATGGLAVGLTVAAIGVGVGDAVWSTQRYQVAADAAGAHLNPEEALIDAQTLQGEEFWLVLAWVGIGIDMADAIKAVRLLRGGLSAEEVVKAVPSAEEGLRYSRYLPPEDAGKLDIGQQVTTGKGELAADDPRRVIEREPDDSGLFYKPGVKVADLGVDEEGRTFDGVTDLYGNITISSRLEGWRFWRAYYHECVHSFLSPKLMILRDVRADFSKQTNKALLRYLEEVICEAVGQATASLKLQINLEPNEWEEMKKMIESEPINPFEYPIKHGGLSIQDKRRSMGAVGLIGSIYAFDVAYLVYLWTQE